MVNKIMEISLFREDPKEKEITQVFTLMKKKNNILQKKKMMMHPVMKMKFFVFMAFETTDADAEMDFSEKGEEVDLMENLLWDGKEIKKLNIKIVEEIRAKEKLESDSKIFEKMNIDLKI